MSGVPAAGPDNAIETRGLSLWYGAFQALFDVSADIKKGIKDANKNLQKQLKQGEKDRKAIEKQPKPAPKPSTGSAYAPSSDSPSSNFRPNMPPTPTTTCARVSPPTTRGADTR